MANASIDTLSSSEFALTRAAQIRAVAEKASATTTDEQLAQIRAVAGYESYEKKDSVGVCFMTELNSNENVLWRLIVSYGRDGAAGRLTFPEGVDTVTAFQVATSWEGVIAKFGMPHDVWVEHVGRDIDVLAYLRDDGTVRGESLEEILANVHALSALLLDRYDWLYAVAGDDGDEEVSFALEEWGAPYELVQYARVALLPEEELTDLMRSVSPEGRYAGMEWQAYERRFLDSVEEAAVPWAEVLEHYGLSTTA